MDSGVAIPRDAEARVMPAVSVWRTPSSLGERFEELSLGLLLLLRSWRRSGRMLIVPGLGIISNRFTRSIAIFVYSILSPWTADRCLKVVTNEKGEAVGEVVTIIC